ncbi:MAG: hypothetical protein KKF12_22185 [Proteobacteria bacterium]|nr:hypothetical protein [Desulfobacula sp.]MBU3950705.1 hypothetical protein [Pseudomonadota bacterium]MBU4133539.1 hypothetical protein [Pseudomonadota bacterium]
MTYLTSMGNILTFNMRYLQREIDMKRLQVYAILNVLVLGVIYGCSAAMFSQGILLAKGFDATAFNPLKIIVAGIPVAFFMHAGAALFIWVFLKAMGGKANFLTSYFHIGTAAISLWLVAPFAAALQTGAVSPVITLLTGIFSLYAFAVNVRVIKTAFQLSTLKMTIATLVTLMYISCFLYLWV